MLITLLPLLDGEIFEVNEFTLLVFVFLNPDLNKACQEVGAQ